MMFPGVYDFDDLDDLYTIERQIVYMDTDTHA